MPVTMKDHKADDTLVMLFGPNSQELKKLKLLRDAGASVAFGLLQFTIKFTSNEVYSCKLPVIVTGLEASTAAQKATVRQDIKDTIEQAFSNIHHLTSLKAAPAFTPKADVPIANVAKKTTGGVFDDLKAEVKAASIPAKASADLPPHLKAKASDKEKSAAKVAGAPHDLTVASFEPLLVSNTVKLADARAVGQKVFGTSSTSVYRCAAVGDVNIGVRLDGSKLSVRVESKHGLTDALVAQLTKLGFTQGNGYISVHLDVKSVPPIRAIGALVYSMGCRFYQITTSLEEING